MVVPLVTTMYRESAITVKHADHEPSFSEFMLIAKWYLFPYEWKLMKNILDILKFSDNELLFAGLEGLL